MNLYSRSAPSSCYEEGSSPAANISRNTWLSHGVLRFAVISLFGALCFAGVNYGYEKETRCYTNPSTPDTEVDYIYRIGFVPLGSRRIHNTVCVPPEPPSNPPRANRWIYVGGSTSYGIGGWRGTVKRPLPQGIFF